MSERRRGTVGDLLRGIFLDHGVLPILLVVAIIVFTLASDNFLTWQNMLQLLRQASYLVLVSLGQMFALITGGFDLAVGTTVAVTSVVGAKAMVGVLDPGGANWALAIAAGLLAGLGAGLLIGLINGAAVAFLGISPFIITLGMSSIGFGISLYMTGGVPVYGMPPEFSDIFGFGRLWGIPTPILISILVFLVLLVVMTRSRLGRYFYAVGGNIKAARLSGVNTTLILLLAYVLSAGLASLSGLLLTARLETGESNIGTTLPLESIAACVIAGVSLRGGVGRVENVVMGAIFITLVQNGMNLARIESYLQIVVIGVLLIFAVAVDQIRLRWLARHG